MLINISINTRHRRPSISRYTLHSRAPPAASRPCPGQAPAQGRGPARCRSPGRWTCRCWSAATTPPRPHAAYTSDLQQEEGRLANILQAVLIDS